MGALGSIVGAVASIWGANKAAKATTQAADQASRAQVEATRMTTESQEKMQREALAAQMKAQAQAEAVQREMQGKALEAQRGALARQQELLSPYRTAGTQGLYQYLYRIGAGAPQPEVYKAAFANTDQATRLAELQARIAQLRAPGAAAAAPGAAAAPATPAAVTSTSTAPATNTAAPTSPEYLAAVGQIKTLYPGADPSQYDALISIRFGPAYLNKIKPAATATTPAAATATTPAAATATPAAAESAVAPATQTADERAVELARAEAELASLQQQAKADQAAAEGFTPWNLEESPTYRLQMQDTQREIDRALRARGLYSSQKALDTQSENARRLAAAEQAAQLQRLTGLTSMGQEASAGMAGSGLTAAGQMAGLYGSAAGQLTGLYGSTAGQLTSMYGQGAQTLANAYQQQATGIGNAAMTAGGAKAAQYGNIGGAIMDAYNSYNQNRMYSQPASSAQPAKSTTQTYSGYAPGMAEWRRWAVA